MLTPGAVVGVHVIVATFLGGASVIDHEKLQNGRLWGYMTGIAVFVAVVAWKLVTR